jgi:glycerate kinase
MAAGVADAFANAEIERLPLSDGGPGLLDVLLRRLEGERVEVGCSDPLMRPIRASIGIARNGLAVIEMAEASGLKRITPQERNALVATTFGTGELLRAALDRGCRTLIIGVGGSATVDAGAGAMQALGARLLDASGSDLPRGAAALARLDRIVLDDVDPLLSEATVRVASDVRNTLLGPTGAAVMFGPQKGASPEDVRVLEGALTRFAAVARRDCGVDVAAVEGSGAAGGLGAGLMALCAATIESGFDLVAQLVRLRDRIAAADVVLTGEGRLDEQTSYGKTVAGVCRLAREAGRPVGVIAGSVAVSSGAAPHCDGIEQLAAPGEDEQRAMTLAGPLLRAAAAQLVRRLAGNPL